MRRTSDRCHHFGLREILPCPQERLLQPQHRLPSGVLQDHQEEQHVCRLQHFETDQHQARRRPLQLEVPQGSITQHHVDWYWCVPSRQEIHCWFLCFHQLRNVSVLLTQDSLEERSRDRGHQPDKRYQECYFSIWKQTPSETFPWPLHHLQRWSWRCHEKISYPKRDNSIPRGNQADVQQDC